MKKLFILIYHALKEEITFLARYPKEMRRLREEDAKLERLMQCAEMRMWVHLTTVTREERKP
jgi:hypothetical protein